jgi:hypothetical protein
MRTDLLPVSLTILVIAQELHVDTPMFFLLAVLGPSPCSFFLH